MSKKEAAPKETPLESFEKEAEAFYKDTGFLAPGKSESPAAIGQTDFERHEVRQLLKRAWDSGRRRAVNRTPAFEALVVALKSVEFGDYNRFAHEICCAECGGLQSEGHEKDCQVAAALALAQDSKGGEGQ